MAFNITTDYAVRTLLYLASNASVGVSISGKEIAEEMKIPYNYFLKIIPALKNAGFLISFQGKKGGYALNKTPAEITVYDIVHAMNDDLIVSQCLENPAVCSRDATGHCAVHHFFEGLQCQLDHQLKTITLENIVANQEAINLSLL